MEDPWGDLNAPEDTSEQQLPLFYVTPAKNQQACQNNICPKMKLKLAKQVKKEPRKASFPWDLGLLFVQTMKYALITGFNLFKTEKEIQSMQPTDFL